MIGSSRFNVGFGAFGALLTFTFSINNNLFTTTVVRACYAFIVFTAIAFFVSLFLRQLLNPKANKQIIDIPEEERGVVLDIVTPDEDAELTDLMKARWAEGKEDKEDKVIEFQPLQPKRMVSLDNPNPEEVVQAIRRLTDE